MINSGSIISIGNAQRIDKKILAINTISYAASALVGTAPDNYYRFGNTISDYSTAPFWSIGKLPTAMLDFRGAAGYIGTGTIPKLRVDGLAASLRGSVRAGIYAGLAATSGPYIVFGRSAMGSSGKGWGDHGSVVAPRLDFTARSNVNTTWNGLTGWIPTLRPNELATPFRGDKVNVIDFRKNNLENAYRWKPVLFQANNALGKFIQKPGLTSDFIKFFFTGPSILAGDTTTKDDIIVFRATISSLQESYTAGWSPVQMIGRADPNYQYTQFNRDLSLDFTVYATDRDEMKPIYRKLNALAGYTAPSYNTGTIGLAGPWMRMTIGDLFVQQPVILTSLTYNLTDSDTTWEINIEDDPTMMQAPHRVTVSMGLTVIGDQIPEKGGRFYSLAKQYTDGMPDPGNDNWLSDVESSADQRLNQLLDDKLKNAKAAFEKAKKEKNRLSIR